MKILVTGALGFSAHHLVELIRGEPGYELYLTDRVSGGPNRILRCDLTQKKSVEALIAKIRPERIYHLAGSYTNDYDVDYPANVLSAKNILDALLKNKVSARVLLIGSSAEYGFIRPEDNPVNENHALNPAQVYGLTKVYQTHLMNFYCKVHQMEIVMARTFNLFGDGNRISALMFVGKVCQQIKKVKAGKLSRITVGNLEAKRDYIDIREAVKYYQKIMERGVAGQVYNVGSGTSIKMRDLLAQLLREAGLGIDLVDENRPSIADKTDIPEIYADLEKLQGL
ncbi:MAG: GDP-mannose 4,6-dehydratase [Candidatus Omnitrophica bacterium]|nr:GDP-mannose 4,6-dehydratase [Candidatus Omnitrophota bacterium]